MLGKLLKHEFQACARLLLPLYLVMVVCTILDRIVLSLDIFEGITQLIPALITTAYVLSLTAIVIVSFVIIVLRFYKNLITDEGYLMFTLPVKPSQLINSKLIVATVWTLVSVFAVFVSIFAVVITPSNFDSFKEGLVEINEQLNVFFGGLTILFVIEAIIIVLISVINGILHIYASVSIGQLVNGHKVLGSFAAYIAIYFINQIAGVIAMIVGQFLFKDADIGPDFVVKVLMPLMFVFIMLFNTAFYLTANYLFKRKLNLE